MSDREDELRPPVALPAELLHPGSADGDERVLRADEEPVQQNEGRDGDQFQKKGHAPTSRAFVLGGSSFSTETTPEYR
jgi:hypothetical protein